MGSSNQRDIPEQTISTLAVLKLIWPQASQGGCSVSIACYSATDEF